MGEANNRVGCAVVDRQPVEVAVDQRRALVTENGAAYPDVRHGDVVDDPERASYVERHLGAIADGVHVGGYFVWSLLDNFEWAFGYSHRFGIVYVDFDTLERVPKTSFRRYRDLIADHVAVQAGATVS